MNVSVIQDFEMETVPCSNLSGIMIRATAPEWNLTQGEIVFEEVNGNLEFKSGFGVNILLSLQIALGFKIQVVPAKGWATQSPNGSWFGMAQKVIDDEADVSIAKTNILQYRAKALSYLIPTHGFIGFYGFFVQPNSNSVRNIFYEPFSLPLWIGIVVICTLLIMSVKILSRVANCLFELSDEDKGLEDEIAIYGICNFLQGLHISPTLICLRIAIISGLIFGLLISISYSAELVSIFSTELIPIKSVLDLLRSNLRITLDKDKLGVIGSLMLDSNSSSTENEDVVKILFKERLKHETNYLLPASLGAPLALRGEGVFLTSKDNFYAPTRNGSNDAELCINRKISTVPLSRSISSGLFARKGSKFKEPLNIKIILLYNSGLMRRYTKEYEGTYFSPRCLIHGASANSTPVISLGDIISLIYSLILCYLNCIIFSLGEYCVSKYSERENQHGKYFCECDNVLVL